MDDIDLESAGGRLKWARNRTDTTADAFARAMGLKPVSYRAYENNQNGYAKHAHRFAEALGVPAAWLLEGGDRPDTPIPLQIATTAVPFKMEGAADIHVPDDVPVYGTVLGAPRDFDGEAIEQTYLHTGEVMTYLKRPPILNGMRDVYGAFVVGNSMYPRYSEGDPVFVDGKRPPKIGDDVVLYLRAPDEHNGERDSAVLIKRLVRRTAHFYELEQFTPHVTFRVETEKVSKIHRVITPAEIFA